MNKIEIRQLDEKLWVIDEQQKVSLFMLSGSEKVLLIDTGSGMVDLHKEIQSMCGEKPIITVNTHAHLDHILGNNQFEEVYVGRYDERELHLSEEVIMTGDEVAYFRDGMSEEYIKNWKPGLSKKIRTLKENDILDLGDLKVRVLEVPSHTLGSVAFYEENKGWIFTGDMVLPWEAWGWLENSATLRQYYQSVQKLSQLSGRFKKVFPSHSQEQWRVDGYSQYELPVSIFKIYEDGLKRILKGEYTYDTFEYTGRIHGRDVKDIPKRKVSFSLGGIIFNPEKLGI